VSATTVSATASVPPSATSSVAATTTATFGKGRWSSHNPGGEGQGEKRHWQPRAAPQWRIHRRAPIHVGFRHRSCHGRPRPEDLVGHYHRPISSTTISPSRSGQNTYEIACHFRLCCRRSRWRHN